MTQCAGGGATATGVPSTGGFARLPVCPLAFTACAGGPWRTLTRPRCDLSRDLSLHDLLPSPHLCFPCSALDKPGRTHRSRCRRTARAQGRVPLALASPVQRRASRLVALHRDPPLVTLPLHRRALACWLGVDTLPWLHRPTTQPKLDDPRRRGPVRHPRMLHSRRDLPPSVPPRQQRTISAAGFLHPAADHEVRCVSPRVDPDAPCGASGPGLSISRIAVTPRRTLPPRSRAILQRPRAVGGGRCPHAVAGPHRVLAPPTPDVAIVCSQHHPTGPTRLRGFAPRVGLGRDSAVASECHALSFLGFHPSRPLEPFRLRALRSLRGELRRCAVRLVQKGWASSEFREQARGISRTASARPQPSCFGTVQCDTTHVGRNSEPRERGSVRVPKA